MLPPDDDCFEVICGNRDGSSACIAVTTVDQRRLPEAEVVPQLAPRPSQARDRVMKMQAEWVAKLIEGLRQACDDGELQSEVDLDLLVFEITAMMFRANFAWIVTEDGRVLDQARLAIRNVLSRVAVQKTTSRQARKPRKA